MEIGDFSGLATAVVHGSARPNDGVPPDAPEIVSFWIEAGPGMWFAKDRAFDPRFYDRFITQYEAAARGELIRWATLAHGALALVLLFDQFPRNAFRDMPRVYATAPLAHGIAETAIGAGYDRAVDEMLALIFYLPFAHSEGLADQERSVELGRNLPLPVPEHSRRHRDIIRRFPHRNAVLGRRTTQEEAAYLASGGYSGRTSRWPGKRSAPDLTD